MVRFVTTLSRRAGESNVVAQRVYKKKRKKKKKKKKAAL